jgi:hypothetical protein
VEDFGLIAFAHAENLPLRPSAGKTSSFSQMGVGLQSCARRLNKLVTCRAHFLHESY